KDMKLHEKREFPPAFQKKPSDAIPCVRGEIIDSDTDSDSDWNGTMKPKRIDPDPDPDSDLDETLKPETLKPRNLKPRNPETKERCFQRSF
ncbi:MAG TPA: hypothetical protein PK576_09900, partial [Kiritimatiellia bacterium]|nr:hypothetical protein [Kiritimatiellia bacterium]